MDRRMSGGGGGGDGHGHPGEAFGWGILSASSLVLGATIGILRLPGRVVRAAMMAFGGGALIEALSIELFAHIIETARGGGHGGEHGGHGEVDRGLVFLALGSALAGGLLFAGLDTALSSQGAFLRKASTVHAYVNRLRYALMRRLTARLKMVPMFEVLEAPELDRLARSMVKERYAAGSTIFQELSRDSSIYFVLSGHVDLTVTTQYAGAANGRDFDGGLAPEAVLVGVGDSPTANSRQTTPPTAVEGALDEVKDFFRLGPNDIFGEMALFTGETLQAKAVAHEAACVLRIPRAAIHRLLASNRRLQDFVAMTAIDRLRETEVFCRCTPSTVARLVSFMRQAEFEAGDVLFYDVDALCPIYFVVLGCVEVARGRGQEGERHTVHANGLLGTEHLVLGHAVHATATAVERTTVLIVQRSDIDKLCEKDERFRQALVASAPGLVARNPAASDETRVVVSLDPPEGAVGPSRFGCAHLEELGWQRQRSPSPSIDPKDGEENNPNSGVPTVSEPFTEEEMQERRRIEEEEDGGLLAGDIDLPDLLANQDAAAVAAGKEGHHGHDGGRGAQAAIMIWLGILIDGVPESFVMGILVNTASQGTLLAFVVGVFLANFPEAMSSAGTMRLHGMRTQVIMLMWISIMVMTGLGACIGAVIFPPGSQDDPDIVKVIAVIEGMCGGAMLCMIANTVLPEAFEQGGNVTGLSTLLGFIVAVAVSVAH